MSEPEYEVVVSAEQQQHAEELGDERGRRGTENLFASSLLEHASRGNDDHLFDQLVSFLRIVGNQNHGKVELTQDPKQFPS